MKLTLLAAALGVLIGLGVVAIMACFGIIDPALLLGL